jgi:hypothetical protein
MTITFCNTVAARGQEEEIDTVIGAITGETTAEEFNQLMRRWLPGDRSYLSHGGRTGRTVLVGAVLRGNVRLIEPIVRRAGPPLLEVGNWDGGWTPLLYAVRDSHGLPADIRYAVVRKLIELGAGVNKAARGSLDIRIPYGATPLWVALNTNQLAIAKLLLVNGAATEVAAELFAGLPRAAIPRALAAAQMPRDRLAAVQGEIEAEMRPINQAILGAVQNLPEALAPIISAYAGHPDIVERVVLPPPPPAEAQSCQYM